MNDIHDAIDLANKIHEDQLDKGGQHAAAVCVFHLLRVASKFKNESHHIVAVLHDTVEDCKQSEIKNLCKHIRSNYSSEILDAIIAITRKENESYMDFIKRVSENEIAMAVKIEDLKDNMDLSRLKNDVTHEDTKRQKKYQKPLNI